MLLETDEGMIPVSLSLTCLSQGAHPVRLKLQLNKDAQQKGTSPFMERAKLQDFF